jgi:hypothetical protein
MDPQAWKNSNDILKLTNTGPRQYKYVFKPTLAEWYETDAATAYARGLSFLVKPKDGGGFGDPDIKSEDVDIAIDPPATERDPAWMFPASATETDLITVTYENFRDTTSALENLGPDDLYIYINGQDADGNNYRIENFFNTPSNPKLKMDYIGNQTFRKQFVPQDFIPVPPGIEIVEWDFRLVTPALVQVPYTIKRDISCQ